MLHVQRYLRSGGTLQSLHQKFSINHVLADGIGLVALNYQTLSPNSDPLVAECRALFLELDTWEVAFKSMNGFYSLSDPRSVDAIKDLDWESTRAYEKRDGALIALYFYKGEWRVGSRFAAVGGWMAYGLNGIKHNYTWRELVQAAVADSGLEWSDFTSRLNPDIFYSCEICSPENRVGVVYENRSLTLIAAVERATLKEIDIETVPFPLPKACFTLVHSQEEVMALVQGGKEAHEMEGLVLCDKNFVRAKVYNPRYLETMNTYGVQSEQEQLANIVKFNALSVTYDSPYNPILLSLDQGVREMASEPRPSMLFRVLALCKHIADTYERIAAGEALDTSLWPEAYEKMREGMSATEVLDNTPEERVLEVLYRFESGA